MKSIQIIKASGESTHFQTEKLIASLRKAGASENLIADIAKEIEGAVFEGMTTNEIYKKAFAKLKKHSRPVAARYKLKKAIMELGETGYPFEKFVAALLASEGFEVEVGVILQGHCVKHEVDVIAQKDTHHYMCECKFHNRQGRSCSVKTPLYIQSRFKDLERVWQKKPAHSNKFHQGWIFTNTRFTTDAMQYGKCIGLQLISWDYPENGSIKDRVDRSGIHPITCLTTLTAKEKKTLIKLNKILCMDLRDAPELLHKIHVNKPRHRRILEEVASLCPK